ncbi:hypothetical protein ACHAXR_001607 [Thalassiosira sp. AJA248-18]
MWRLIRKRSWTKVFEYTSVEGSVPKNVTRVIFSTTVTEVGDNAFDGCTKLKEVVLNEGLQKIGRAAFLGCKSLERIKFPSTLTEVGFCAFDGCKKMKEVVINEGLRKIGRAAFLECKSLKRIEFPSTLTEVGFCAFCSCKNLKDVVLHEGLRKIGGGAFYGCSLERIKFPSTLTEVGDSAFFGCIKLNGVFLNEGLQKIGAGAFYGCSLESIKFPSTLIVICHDAFRDCKQVKEVMINEGLQKIGRRAFDWCPHLESIKFPCISRRLEVLIQNSRAEIENKINEIPGVEWRGAEMLISFGATGYDDWKRTRERILGLVTHYELKEATTIFELALWKARISTEAISSVDERDECRIDVVGPVKDAVLQFISIGES